MSFDNFMRLILMFDLPTITANDRRIYRKFVKFLINDGYCRINYSVYAKLCINSDSAKTAAKRVIAYSPSYGDIRYLIISERQYQNITNVNCKYSLQEQLITTDRVLIIGGMNNEDSK